MAGVDDIDIDSPIEIVEHKPGLKPAKSMSEFLGQLAAAKSSGVKEMEATLPVLKYITSGSYDPKIGYMIYQDVFVYEEGQKERVRAGMSKTMEQALFGHSKVTIDRTMTHGSKP